MKVRQARIGASLLAVLLAATAACSARGTDANDKEITLLTAAAAGTPGGKVLRAILADFTSETGIKVKVDVAGADLPTVYETSLAAGREADVVNINPVDKPLTWIDNKAAIPVGKFLDEWKLRDRVSPAALEEWTRDDGKVQGFPYEGFQWPVWYNTELLTKAGVTSIPATIDQLIDAANKLRAAGIQPIAIGGNDWSGQKLFFQIVQSYLSQDDTRKVFAKGDWCGNQNAMRGIELFTRLRDAKVFEDNAEGFDAPSMVAHFMAGQAAIMPAGSWTFADVPAGLVDKIQLAGMPVPADGTYAKPTAFEGTANGFWISPNGEKKIDQVRKLIEYLYRPDIAGRFVREADVLVVVDTESSTVEGSKALLKNALTELPKKVDYAVLPDSYVPGNISASVIRDSATAFAKGKSAQDICGALDKTYRG